MHVLFSTALMALLPVIGAADHNRFLCCEEPEMGVGVGGIAGWQASRQLTV
jgi:hypothetical protein